MSCALRKLDRVELLVPTEVSRLYAKKLREFKVELKLEKLCDADGGVVCTHGEVGWGEWPVAPRAGKVVSFFIKALLS